MSPPQMLLICLINNCVGRLFDLHFYAILLYTTGWKASNYRCVLRRTNYYVCGPADSCLSISWLVSNLKAQNCVHSRKPKYTNVACVIR
jgi:hypothetical protein